MWLWFSLAALLFWSGSDLFSKIGCQDSRDRYSHLKMVTAVGVVMGLHAAYEVFFNGVEINWSIIVTYLPVSCLYILSMTIGYLGLRYIELSISSPICNSSGAIVAVLTLATAGLSEDLPPISLVAVALVCLGVIGLGFIEAHEDEDLRRARQDASNHHYAKSFLAILLPVIYCLLDALGTFADSRVPSMCWLSRNKSSSRVRKLPSIPVRSLRPPASSSTSMPWLTVHTLRSLHRLSLPTVLLLFSGAGSSLRKSSVGSTIWPLRSPSPESSFWGSWISDFCGF